MKSKIFAVAALIVGIAGPAFAGGHGSSTGSSSSNTYAGLSTFANSGPGNGAALSGGVVVSTAMNGPAGSTSSVQGLTTAQSIGHANAGAQGAGVAATNSAFAFQKNGLHW